MNAAIIPPKQLRLVKLNWKSDFLAAVLGQFRVYRNFIVWLAARRQDCFAVLEIPPVDSPQTAVKMAIYSDIKKGLK